MSDQDRKKQDYAELSTVESQRNDLAWEEFPEGPYGMTLEEATEDNLNPKRKEQRSTLRFGYENKQLHANLPRDYPGEDPSEH